MFRVRFSTAAAVAAAISACGLAAAGELDGPCLMHLSTYTGSGCHDDIASCLQNVTLGPGAFGFPSVTTSGVEHGGVSCFDQPKSASLGRAGTASVSMNWVNGTTMTFYGDSDKIPRGYAAFLVTNKAAIVVCSGRFEVRDGVCLFSDQGPGGSPTASPTPSAAHSSQLESWYLVFLLVLSASLMTPFVHNCA